MSADINGGAVSLVRCHLISFTVPSVKRLHISVSLNFRRRKMVYAGFNNSFLSSHRIQSMPVTKTTSLVLYGEIIALAAYCVNRKESRRILRGHNTEIVVFNLVVNIVNIGH